MYMKIIGQSNFSIYSTKLSKVTQGNSIRFWRHCIQHGSFGNGNEMAMTATAITTLALSIVFVIVMEIAVETRRSQKVGREAIHCPSF